MPGFLSTLIPILIKLGRNARKNIDTSCRAHQFMSEFGSYSSYGIPEGYFEPTDKNTI